MYTHVNFFHSIKSYATISCGGMYKISLTISDNLHKRILKLANKEKIVNYNPLKISQLFEHLSHKVHYNNLIEKFLNCNSRTWKINILFPKTTKKTIDKHTTSILLVVLTNHPELKTIDIGKKCLMTREGLGTLDRDSCSRRRKTFLADNKQV